MGRALVRDFHTRCLYQKSNERAQRAKIPYARPAHKVISRAWTPHATSLSDKKDPQ